MNIETLQSKLAEYVLTNPDNAIQADWALREEIVGTPMFDAPIVGCASADDPLFARIKAEDKILREIFKLISVKDSDGDSVLSSSYRQNEVRSAIRRAYWPSRKLTVNEEEIPTDAKLLNVQYLNEHREELVARDALLSLGALEEETELLFAHAVDGLGLLLLPELHAVFGHFPAAFDRTVLPRRIGTPVENLVWPEHGLAETTRNLAARTCEMTHCYTLLRLRARHPLWGTGVVSVI